MPVPSAISVNMFRWRLTTDGQPRTKNGQPPQSTTGVASASWIQAVHRSPSSRWTGRPGSMSPMASRNTGRVSTRLIQNRRVMSTSSGLGGSSAGTVIGSSAMPQIGQSPGSSRTISGCIGQV